MDVLVADDVRHTYGETVALDGVSLTVGAGEILGLVGPNGAGKTTLVRALTGTLEAAGRVELFGEGPGAVDRERVGLLPQDFDPPDRLTPRELLAYYGGLYDDSRPTDELLGAVGVAETADTYYENLSGGQQRRTCVATALVNDPDLLILDEPTTGIDPAGRRHLWALLEQLAADGTTIVLTTHYMAEAEHLADRVGLLAEGRLVAIDTPAALVAEYGGQSVLTVEATVDADVAAALPYVVTRTDDALLVEDVEPAAIGDVAATLDEHGVAYDALSWREPDLEDVYLALTGAEFAAGDAPDAPGVLGAAQAPGTDDAADPGHQTTERVPEGGALGAASTDEGATSTDEGATEGIDSDGLDHGPAEDDS